MFQLLLLALQTLHQVGNIMMYSQIVFMTLSL